MLILLVTILFSLLFINPQSIAHHKENSFTVTKDTDGMVIKKQKRIWKQSQKRFLCFEWKRITVKEAGKPVKDQNTGKQTLCTEIQFLGNYSL